MSLVGTGGLVQSPAVASTYLGVLIEQSLRDPSFLDTVEIVHRQRAPHGSWVFLLVRVPRERSTAVFKRLQSALNPGQWYAHFFDGDDLAVVYPDAVFSMKTDPATWSGARAHGLGLGIPEAQLDYCPHTIAKANDRFGTALS
jgi:hypothetical protein